MYKESEVNLDDIVKSLLSMEKQKNNACPMGNW